MRRMRIWGLTGAAALFLLAGPVQAQGQPPPSAAGVPSPRSEALVRRFLAAAKIDRTMDALLTSIVPLMIDDARRQYPRMSADDGQKIGEVVRDVMRDVFLPRLIDRMVPIYAATFSESELQAIVDFYESPAGRAITDKTPGMAPASAQAARDLLPQMQREIVLRMCARMDCFGQKTPPPAKPTAS